jgi:hypothetical protein
MICKYFKNHDSIIDQLLFLLSVLSCNTCPARGHNLQAWKNNLAVGRILLQKANDLFRGPTVAGASAAPID